MSENKKISKDVIFDRIVTAIGAFFDCPDEIITPDTVALNFNNVSEIVDAVFSHLTPGGIDNDGGVA